LTFAQAGMVTTLGAVRPGAGLSLALLTVMAFLNGWRSMIASGLGMESAPDDKVTVMSMRAAANQFGYLLGAALGGLALAAGGFGMMGMTFSSLFALGAFLHLVPRMTTGPSAAAQPA
jgi:predicted MFS family arabinose efflux permease